MVGVRVARLDAGASRRSPGVQFQTSYSHARTNRDSSAARLAWCPRGGVDAAVPGWRGACGVGHRRGLASGAAMVLCVDSSRDRREGAARGRESDPTPAGRRAELARATANIFGADLPGRQPAPRQAPGVLGPCGGRRASSVPRRQSRDRGHGDGSGAIGAVGPRAWRDAARADASVPDAGARRAGRGDSHRAPRG